jgi:hypothetical protein
MKNLLSSYLEYPADRTGQPEKANISKLLDAAIKQIRKNRYYERFMNESQVSLLGVVFAGNEIGCRMENLR